MVDDQEYYSVILVIQFWWGFLPLESLFPFLFTVHSLFSLQIYFKFILCLKPFLISPARVITYQYYDVP